MTFTVGDENYKLIIPPQGYLLEVVNEDGSEPIYNCLSGIMGWPEAYDYDVIMIGQTFMKNYYMLFDYDSKTISLASNSHNSWAQDISPKDDKNGKSEEDLLFIVFGSCMFILLVIFICIRLRASDKQRQEAENKVTEDLYGDQNTHSRPLNASVFEGEKVYDDEKLIRSE